MGGHSMKGCEKRRVLVRSVAPMSRWAAVVENDRRHVHLEVGKVVVGAVVARFAKILRQQRHFCRGDGLRAHVHRANGIGKAAGHDCRSGRRADRCRGERPVESGALCGQAVQIRRQRIFGTWPDAPVAAEIRVDVVRGNPNYVGLVHAVGASVNSVACPIPERNWLVIGSPVPVLQRDRLFLFRVRTGARSGISARFVVLPSMSSAVIRRMFVTLLPLFASGLMGLVVCTASYAFWAASNCRRSSRRRAWALGFATGAAKNRR